MNRSRRHDKTAAEKLELFNRYKTFTFMSQREAADRLGISRGRLQGLTKNEALIRSSDTASGIKRKRSGKDEDVGKALFDWFQFTRLRNAPVNGPILMEKANNIADAAGHANFKATDGWFNRWKKRFSVAFTTLKVSYLIFFLATSLFSEKIFIPFYLL